MGLLDDAIREHLELKRRRGADAGDISREESEALGPVRRGPDGAPDLPDTFAAGQAAAGAPPAGPSWDSDETAVLGSSPAADDLPAHDLPAPGDYEPPSAPVHEAPSAGYGTPPLPAREPTVRTPAYEPPTTAYVPPAAPPPQPAFPPQPEPERPWFQAQRSHDEPEPDPFEHDALQPDRGPSSEPEPEHPSLLSRFRLGRRSKQAPPPADSDEPPASYEPPPLPASFEPASPYEPPPPATPSPAYSYDTPAVHHEPDIVPADDEPDVEDVLEETPDFLEETPEHDRLWFEQRPPRDFDFDDK